MSKKEDKQSILVVDDSRTTREMLEDELRTLGYKTYLAESAEDAEKVLSKHEIDIMFLDIRLPGIGGLEYLERLRKEGKDIIVIVVTAYESTASAVEAIEKGAYDYVIKPIDPSHIELIIKRALKRYEIEQERNAALEKRMTALEDFSEIAKLESDFIRELKLEVNNLLKDMSRKPKYKV